MWARPVVQHGRDGGRVARGDAAHSDLSGGGGHVEQNDKGKGGGKAPSGRDVDTSLDSRFVLSGPSKSSVTSLTSSSPRTASRTSRAASPSSPSTRCVTPRTRSRTWTGETLRPAPAQIRRPCHPSFATPHFPRAPLFSLPTRDISIR